jgi:hypothetical protein
MAENNTSGKTEALTVIPPELQDQIVQILPNIERLRLYRGKGGEMIREVVCKLIEAIAKASKCQIIKFAPEAKESVLSFPSERKNAKV